MGASARVAYAFLDARRGKWDICITMSAGLSVPFKSGPGKSESHATIHLAVGFPSLPALVRVTGGWRHRVDLSCEPRAHASTSKSEDE